MAEQTRKKADADKQDSGLLSQLPVDRLREEAMGLGRAFGRRSLDKLGSGVEGITDRLTGFAEGIPTKRAKAAADKVAAPVDKVKDTVGQVAGNLSRSEQSTGKKLKVTNIVETIDVPVSREVAYEQWTQFEEFPTFMKKVENVTQEDDEVVTWQAQIFWSHRTWKATILDQVPNEHIVWKSQSEKGRVDGAVTFHELAPTLTRILVSLEYHPKGLFEHTGNLWRAQGRRVRLEMKHFRRHVANHALLHRDEIEGWTGEIHDKQVVDDGSEDSPKKSQKSRTSSSSRSSEKSASSSRPPAKKTTAKKTTAKKSTAKKTTAKKSAPKKSTVRKPSAKKSETTQSATKQSPRKQSPKKQSATKRTAARSSSKKPAARQKATES